MDTRGSRHRYKSVGRWERTPLEGAHWTQPHYDHYREGWQWHEAHWEHEEHKNDHWAGGGIAMTTTTGDEHHD